MRVRVLRFIAVVAAAAPAFSLSPTPVAQFFPFQPGTRWTYHFEQSIEGVSPSVDEVAGSWSDTVSDVDRVSPSLQIVAITRTGKLPQDFGECPGGAAMPTTVHFWYIVQPTRVFVRCTEAEARSLAVTLASSSAAPISSDDAPDYVLPFRVGAYWGNDPAVVREDAMYRWNVAAQGPVQVPAGLFKGCFETSYDTLPDDEERWVCPGVGLVEQDYDHHGTVNEITIKLTGYQTGHTSGTQ